MSSIATIIDVFKLEKIEPDRRIKIIKELGEVVNFEFAANATDGLVKELVELLEEEAATLKEERAFWDEEIKRRNKEKMAKIRRSSYLNLNTGEDDE